MMKANIYGTDVSAKIVDGVLKKLNKQGKLFQFDDERLGLEKYFNLTPGIANAPSTHKCFASQAAFAPLNVIKRVKTAIVIQTADQRPQSRKRIGLIILFITSH